MSRGLFESYSNPYRGPAVLSRREASQLFAPFAERARSSWGYPADPGRGVLLLPSTRP